MYSYPWRGGDRWKKKTPYKGRKNALILKKEAEKKDSTPCR